VPPRWLLAGAGPSQSLGSAAGKNSQLVRGLRLARLVLAPLLLLARLLLVPRCPSAGAGSVACPAVATFSHGTAPGTALLPNAVAIGYLAKLLRARRAVRSREALARLDRRNSQFAVSVSLVFSSQRGLRSCLNCLARFIGCFPVLLINKMGISGNDVPAELAPLPLLALLLFLRGFSSRRAALRLVRKAKRGCSCDLFPRNCSQRRALARSSGRCLSCSAAARATHGPVRGHCVCELRRGEMWWLLGGCPRRGSTTEAAQRGKSDPRSLAEFIPAVQYCTV
jgi:hypothetical protein